MADNVEPIMIASLETFALSGLSKDKAVKNKDIVKPIPASKDIPTMCFIVVFSCKAHIFERILMKTNVEMPNVFPMNKARMMPIPRLEKMCGILAADKAMVVLAKAKTGSMK